MAANNYIAAAYIYGDGRRLKSIRHEDGTRRGESGTLCEADAHALIHLPVG
ncbi:MAG: hypothetical protein M3119_00700 [Verrucomicrobiota bacterium]|nr:hypothetical protein [Verrucomicrobiota bacterium]